MMKSEMRHGQLNSGLAAVIRSGGLIAIDDLDRAERTASSTQTRLDRVLLELGLMEEGALADAIATWAGLPRARLGDYTESAETDNAWDEAWLRRAMVFPMLTDTDGLHIAMADPLDDQLVQTLTFQQDQPVIRHVSARQEIAAALDRAFSAMKTTKPEPDTAATADIERIRGQANEGPIVRLVQDILTAGVDARASDVHFEAMETELQVRFRIDGELRRQRPVPDSESAAVISRLKVMARLNIAERRLPQDGRVRLAIRGRDIDFRISSLPTQFGESIVLRVLDRSRLALDWHTLGFDPGIVSEIEQILQSANGIFLVSGPIGGGKTTSLYTALSTLDAEHRKIVTIEDPIEYSLPGINQVQIDDDIEYGFARALRSTLRQDANIVMVGEIRDLETTQNAIRAALIGRLVLSTVHANSAVATIDRLVNLGASPFLLATTVRGILSQRLVRRLCPDCARPETDPAILHMLERELGDDGCVAPKVPVGCSKCGYTGYRGRLAIAELLRISDAFRSVIATATASTEITELAENAGMEFIRSAGFRAVADGATSLAEVLRAVDLDG